MRVLPVVVILAALLLVVVVVVVIMWAPLWSSDPMQSREARECRRLLDVRSGWSVSEEDRAKFAKGLNASTPPEDKRSENSYDDLFKRLVHAREREVAECVLRMKGGIR